MRIQVKNVSKRTVKYLQCLDDDKRYFSKLFDRPRFFFRLRENPFFRLKNGVLPLGTLGLFSYDGKFFPFIHFFYLKNNGERKKKVQQAII